MTDAYGPMDGHPWNEDEWHDFAYLWAPSGVVGIPASAATSGSLAFSSSGLNVSAGTGKAWAHGAGFERTGTPPTHAATANAHATWQRRDRLVLRRDLANNQVVTAVLQGTSAASPAAPALTQVEGGVWESPLFSFLVPPASGTSITGVVDERGWVSPASPGQLMVATTAARDANFPAPADGDEVVVAGMLQRRYNAQWLSVANNAGTSGVMAGSAPPAGHPLTLKTFYGSVVFNGIGDGTVTFPGGAFPNGLLAVSPVHYSPGTAPSNDLEFVPWGATLSAVNLRCYGPTGAVFGGTGIACVLTAIGW